MYPLFSEKPPSQPQQGEKAQYIHKTQGLGCPIRGAINYSESWERQDRTGGDKHRKGPPYLLSASTSLEG